MATAKLLVQMLEKYKSNSVMNKSKGGDEMSKGNRHSDYMEMSSQSVAVEYAHELTWCIA